MIENACADLKADLDKGLADIAAGRVSEFDMKYIVKCGRKRLAERSIPGGK